ncbi:hypothetical protein DFH06DRAFT_1167846 [Mycena polygramma]|nr:hypothetical protein DFH06DRAFT_1167846 [Mycena polygramma]
MPWDANSDGMPDEVLRQFSLALNVALSSMCPGGHSSMTVLESYAFFGDMANRFIATSSQGRDGSYHHFTPLPPCLQNITDPTHSHRKIQALVIECKLELKEPTESACGAFGHGLANIRASHEDHQYGRWYHTVRRPLYGQVLPETSTYIFQRPLGLRYAFHVVWNTDFYPPGPSITVLPYPANAYIPFETRIPLVRDVPNGSDASPEIVFLQRVVSDGKRKGKERA